MPYPQEQSQGIPNISSKDKQLEILKARLRQNPDLWEWADISEQIKNLEAKKKEESIAEPSKKEELPTIKKTKETLFSKEDSASDVISKAGGITFVRDGIDLNGEAHLEVINQVYRPNESSKIASYYRFLLSEFSYPEKRKLSVDNLASILRNQDWRPATKEEILRVENYIKDNNLESLFFPSPSKEDDSKIDDQREHLERAKKFAFEKIISSIEGISTNELISNPLEKMFKRPKAKALYDKGLLSAEDARFLEALTLSITLSPKPDLTSRKSSVLMVERWANNTYKKLQGLLDFCKATTTSDREEIKTKLLSNEEENKHEAARYEMCRKNMSRIDPKIVGRYYSPSPTQITIDVLDRLGFPDEKVESLPNLNIKASLYGESYLAYFNTDNRGIFDTYERALNKITNIAKSKDKKTHQRFSLNISKEKNGKYCLYYSPLELRIKDGFDSYFEASDWVRVNYQSICDYINSFKEEIKEINSSKTSFFTPLQPRVGEDYRQGRDVAEDDFVQTFGFRRVQFGNWTNQNDRKTVLNEAYDSFMDLSKLLNLSPKTLSLGGELGIAFESQTSSNTITHYEHGEVVINLTKTQGPGNLAHQWWHALDNYFSRHGGNKFCFVTNDSSFNLNIRDDVLYAFKDIVEEINKSRYAKRLKKMGTYWGKECEISARFFAQWISKKLMTEGKVNFFLSSQVREQYMEDWALKNYQRFLLFNREEDNPENEQISYKEYSERHDPYYGLPYPTSKEVSELSLLWDKLFQRINERVECSKSVLFRIDRDYQAKNSYIDFLDEEHISEVENLIEDLQQRFHHPIKKIESLLQVDNVYARANIEKDIKNDTRLTKGWYDTSTRELNIYMPNVTSKEDLSRTILHELKGHCGLHNLFGEENYNKAMNHIYDILPQDEQDKVQQTAKELYGGNIPRAVEERLAEEAEKDFRAAWWDKAVAVIKEILRSIGFDIKFSEPDVRFLLWKSEKKLASGNIIEQQENIDKLKQIEKENIAALRRQLSSIFRVSAMGNIPSLSFNDVLFRIGKNRREYMNLMLDKNRPDLSKDERIALFNYLDTLDSTKLEKITFNWFLIGSVSLPKDSQIIYQAIQVAKRAKVDPIQYESPIALISRNQEFIPSKEKINPDDVECLIDKKELPYGITVYTIDESDGDIYSVMTELRKIIDTHWGRNCNPWCLLASDKDGDVTEEARDIWDEYNGYPKKIAFQNGKLLAFSASEICKVTWWDRMDYDYDGIPIKEKISNDKLGRTATYELNENTGKLSLIDIYRGNRGNGLFEQWYFNEQLKFRGYFKSGKKDGLHEWYDDKGNIIELSNYKEGKKEGLSLRWFSKNVLEYLSNYKNGKKDGLHEQYRPNGLLDIRCTYENGELNGFIEKYRNGTLAEFSQYLNDKKINTITFDKDSPIVSDKELDIMNSSYLEALKNTKIFVTTARGHKDVFLVSKVEMSQKKPFFNFNCKVTFEGGGENYFVGNSKEKVIDPLLLESFNLFQNKFDFKSPFLKEKIAQHQKIEQNLSCEQTNAVCNKFLYHR